MDVSDDVAIYRSQDRTRVRLRRSADRGRYRYDLSVSTRPLGRRRWPYAVARTTVVGHRRCGRRPNAYTGPSANRISWCVRGSIREPNECFEYACAHPKTPDRFEHTTSLMVYRASVTQPEIFVGEVQYYIIKKVNINNHVNNKNVLFIHVVV